MARGGIVLANNVSVVANQSPIVWVGGRTSLVIIATTYPTVCNLQVKGPDDTTFINVNAATIVANQIVSFDLPAGTYRLAMSGGTVSGLYASLVAIPYT